MNHFSISVFKSIIRIIACIILFLATKEHSVGVFSLLFLVAELLGVLEELFDKRKEK